MSKETNPNIFYRYIWLIDTIRCAGHISYEDIALRWMHNSMSDGMEFPLRTFHNHRKAIEQLFDVNIECDKRNGYTYYIENVDDLERCSVRAWLLNTFAVNNLIYESHKLNHRILFEEIPSGQKYLTPIIEAMRDKQILELTCQSYWAETSHTFEVEPYCLKIFKRRWYVLARSVGDGKIRIYALDRIRDLRKTSNRFELPAGFVPKEYFEDAFGIIVDEDYDVEYIKIRAIGIQRKYLRSLPPHHSQIETEMADNYSIFEYRLRATVDFQQELLSRGADVEVLSPQWLREWVGAEIKKMHGIYDK